MTFLCEPVRQAQLKPLLPPLSSRLGDRNVLMDEINKNRNDRPQLGRFNVISDDREDSRFLTRFPGVKPPEHPDWIADRKAFRKALNELCDVEKWPHRRPLLASVKTTADLQEHDDKASKVFSQTYTDSSHLVRLEVEEVKSYLRLHEDSLFRLLDWHGTGQIKQADLSDLFEKEGLVIPPERMKVLMSLLRQDGKKISVENLAAAILTWSREPQEMEAMEMLQDVEVFAIMQRVFADAKIFTPSSLSDPLGREVDRFRRLCLKQYLKSLHLCQKEGLNVSSKTLQRALLYPGDMNTSSIKLGKTYCFLSCDRREPHVACLSTRKNKDASVDCHKKIRKKAFSWADPNAFWPGKEDHVCLFLPGKTQSPAMALFQRIDHTVAPRSSHWPF